MTDSPSSAGAVTDLLARVRAGDATAMDRLFTLVYADLKSRARQQLARGRPGETLDTTAVVHEAYLKLVDSRHTAYNDRVHFFAVASRAMRQILVDAARKKRAAKRGAGVPAVSLAGVADETAGRTVELIALDDALVELAALDQRLARVVELRFFGGLSTEEIAEAMGSSPRTVKRDWQKARALLLDAIGHPPD